MGMAIKVAIPGTPDITAAVDVGPMDRIAIVKNNTPRILGNSP